MCFSVLLVRTTEHIRNGGKAIETKRCTRCGEVKPVSEFYNQSGNKDGKQSWCKKCDNKRKAKWGRKNPDKKREVSWRKRGISLDYPQFLLMLEQQNYKCKICGCDLKKNDKDTHVDHCHATGEIRGVLCSFCNQGIGFLRDSPEILRSAADYLESFREVI